MFLECQSAVSTNVAAGGTFQPSCGGNNVFVFDSVQYGDQACSLSVYRLMSEKCLGKTQCVFSTSEISCSGTTLSITHRCIQSIALYSNRNINGSINVTGISFT